MAAVLLNDPADVLWIFEVHLPEGTLITSRSIGSAVLHGNEDCPDRIDLYHEVNPDWNAVPEAVFIADPDGNLVRSR